MAGPRFTRWSVSALSDDIASYQKLPMACGEAPAGGRDLGVQAIGFRVTCDTSTAGGAIRVVFAHPNGTAIGQGVCEVWDGTVTATSRRCSWDNASGYYVCDVVFTKSGTNFVDVGGCNDDPSSIESRVEVYVWFTGMGSAGTYRVEAWGTRNAQ